MNSSKSRFYSYSHENQNSFNDKHSLKFDRKRNSYNDSRNSDRDNNNENHYNVNSPRQKQKHTPKMKNLIPFFSYNNYVPTTETSTDSKLLSTALEDDIIPETQSNINTNKPSKNAFIKNSESSSSPLVSVLSQSNLNNNSISKVSPNISTTFSPQISPLLLNENISINNTKNNDFNSLTTNSNYSSTLFSNLLNNNYNSVSLGNQGSVSSSLNINNLYAPINNPITNDSSTINSSTNVSSNSSTNNLSFLFSGGLGNEKPLNGFVSNQSSLDSTFGSPRVNNAQLNNSNNDLTHNNSLGGSDSSLPISNLSPIVSPQPTNSSLMSSFSSIPSYYQNLNLSNDVNDLLSSSNSSSFPLDSKTHNDTLKDSTEINNLGTKNNGFGTNSTTPNYLFNNNNYFSTMPNSSEPNKDKYLQDYFNNRLGGYQSFYKQNIFNSGLSGSFFNEPSGPVGTFGTLNSKNDADFSNQQNNVDDEDIDLNFTYNLELSDSESEDVDTSDIDISKIIKLSKKNENKEQIQEQEQEKEKEKVQEQAEDNKLE